jgi:hypothetical protein
MNQRGGAGVKGAHVWLTEASRQKETAVRGPNLSTLCRHNPALKCERAAQGPTLGALLPLPPAAAYSQSTRATPMPKVVWRWL